VLHFVKALRLAEAETRVSSVRRNGIVAQIGAHVSGRIQSCIVAAVPASGEVPASPPVRGPRRAESGRSRGVVREAGRVLSPVSGRPQHRAAATASARTVPAGAPAPAVLRASEDARGGVGDGATDDGDGLWSGRQPSRG